MMSLLSQVYEKPIDATTKAEIDAMDHLEMARLWRFSPPGSHYMRGVNGEYFAQRFEELGGMTYEISTTIGWYKD